MKSFLKKVLRRFDLELRNFSIEKSENARFFTMLSHHKVNTVFDIGANEGQFGVILRDFGYKGKIVSFEPLTEAREKLNRISQDDPLWEIAPQAAIGDEDGEIEIHIAGNSESSSILNMLDSHIEAAPSSKYIGKEKVLLRKLDTLSQDFVDDNSVVFLKIDTQGYEEKVMNGAHALMKNIVGLQLEISLVPLYEYHSLLEEMLQNIKEKGFELWGISTVFSDPKTAQLLQIDATFFLPHMQSSDPSITITETNLKSRNFRKSALVFFKAIVYYIFDSIAVRGIPTSQENTKKTVILIRQDKIGDFIIWLDTAKEYRKLYPPEKYKIVLLGNSLWADLAEKLPYWDQVIPVNATKLKTISRYRRNLLLKVRKLKAEVSIQPTFSREFYHGDSLGRASGAIRNIGSVGDMSNRNWLKKWLASYWHTELISASQEPQTELERNAEFLSAIQPKNHLSSYPKFNVNESWAISDFQHDHFYVLSPGADKNYRKWPASSYAEIVQLIYKKTGWTGLICGTEKEKDIGMQIQKICDVPLENYTGRTDLPELAWLLSKSKLLISNETGSAHTASAVCTETVCILGGGHFKRFAPYPDIPGKTKYFHSVYNKMTCYGCNWECIYSLKIDEPAPCVSNISVDAVWNEVEKIIEAEKS